MDPTSLNEIYNSASSEVLSFFSNPWIGIISFITGLIGFYLRVTSAINSSKKRKIPSYRMRSINVISKEEIIPDLNITYKENPVSNLTVTKIAIWNSGKETINAMDVPEGDPIRIPVSGNNMDVYGVEILHVAEPSNGFRLKPTTEFHAYVIKFDYIDYNQGILLKIIHSGKSSDDIKILGTIKGFGKLTNRSSYFWDNISIALLKGNQAPNKYSTKSVKTQVIISFILIAMTWLLYFFLLRITPILYVGIILTISLSIQIIAFLLYNPIPDGFDILEDTEYKEENK